MTVTINGTTGIAGTNGSAGTPAVQGEDTNTGVFFPAADTVAVTTGGAERMRVDSSGNVGINKNSPTVALDVVGRIRSLDTAMILQSTGDLSTTGTGYFSFRGSDAIERGYTGFGAGNADFYVWNINNANIRFGTASTERMRIDSSGNLGLGVTPSAWSVYKAFDIGRGAVINATTETEINHNAYWNGTNWIYKATDFASRHLQINGQHRWYTAPSGTAGNAITFTQAMTLDASGNLSINKTTTASLGAGHYFSADGAAGHTRASNPALTVRRDTTDGQCTVFLRDATQVGSISVTATATAYNTSSDYRLKENVAPMQNALDTVAQLKPVTYTWKADGSAGQGFIAHELQAVVPDCVTGEKDAVDAEGNPQYQGVDTSFLVATLVKAIQELTARVAELEAK